MTEKFEVELNPGNFHTAVRVKDLKESIKFYHGIPGLPIIEKYLPE